MANDIFIDLFTNAFAMFHPYRISDHAPAVLSIPSIQSSKHKPFKFGNFIAKHENFMETVREGWRWHIEGHTMFRVVKKLRNLKSSIRKLMWQKGDLHKRVLMCRQLLDDAQVNLDSNPFDVDSRDRERVALINYNEAVLEEECFLKQKSKIEWLRVGDSNSSYFHKVVKGKTHRNRIQTVLDANNNYVEGNQVAKVFVDHYTKFLGQASDCTEISNPGSLFINRVNSQKAARMIRPVTSMEIKNAIFDIGDSKSPGPDGFSAAFFKNAWEVIGDEVTTAIKEFFINGQLLKEINSTIISLIPKVQSPCKVNDYRPISCCNVLYKCISKVITNRIKSSLDDIVSTNQSAFVPGRRISDNILLTQELMKNYHLDRGFPRCAFKVDIQKAYDTVDWNFLESTLICFGFPMKMVRWIMKCVSTTSYSININGDLYGYFKGKRGLRQGDPMSPYLFTLIMEVLTLMLNRNVRLSNSFKYHPRCEKHKILNLCFADDLFMFSHGHVPSVAVLRNSLEEFKNCSGLSPSLPKSTVFFANVSNCVKSQILAIMPFDEGKLPVRYLGVPLVSTRLMYRDCKVLVDRVKSKVDDWKNKFLSFAGRVQLIISVLVAMQVYWCSSFILPEAIIKDIEKVLRGFLWCQGDMKRGKAKVKWDDVCVPKDEGGLGIRRLKYWNIALMTNHVWSILTCRKSLWVSWVREFNLSNRNFWDVPIRVSSSWSWRKLLLMRPIIRKFFYYSIGNGMTTSAYYDKWCIEGPLSDLVTPRDMASVGLSLNATVNAMILLFNGNWPSAWLSKYPLLQTISMPSVQDTNDRIHWRSIEGALHVCSTARVWESIRPTCNNVNWFAVVWFSQCIPRHAFLLWLVMGERLKTHDKMKTWEIHSSMVLVCPLCKGSADSHDHLFFYCPFASDVWSRGRMLINMRLDNHWKGVVRVLTPVAARNCADVVVAKIMFAATIYFLWQERNNRIFKKSHRTEVKLFEDIYATVRLKLLSISFKSSHKVDRLKERWCF